MKITAQPYTAYFRIYTLWPGVRKVYTLITQIAKLLAKKEVAFKLIEFCPHIQSIALAGTRAFGSSCFETGYGRNRAFHKFYYFSDTVFFGTS